MTADGSVAGAVADRLVARGIDAVFGVPGEQSLPLTERLRARTGVEFVVARHETAVTHQAWGFAETSGRMAATLVVPGPGDLNAANGLKNAANDCTPLVHLAVEADPELRGGDAIHETPPATYDDLVKANLLVGAPEATVATVDRGIAAARSQPTGPVRVGIPKPFLRTDAPGAAATPTVGRAGAPPDAAVAEAAELLGGADAPVVLAGGGVATAGASDRLVAVAERLGAPVVTTYKGKGVIPEDHPASAGVLSGSASPELLDLLGSADAALAVGSDLDAHGTRGWTVDLPDRLVHVTLAEGDVGRGYEPSVALVADAGAVLDALDERFAAAGRERTGADGRAGAVRRATRERIAPLLGDEPPITSVRALRAVRAALPREAVVTADAGGFRVWALNVFEAYGPRRYVNPGSWASMGTALPSAIGAQYGNPDAPVVALAGDGGLLMCVHELHTAVVHGLPVTVVVLNNDDYAIISDAARRAGDDDTPAGSDASADAGAGPGAEPATGAGTRTGPGAYGWGDAPVSFVAVAEGMGMDATRVETPGGIRECLDRALASGEPTLVEVRTDPAEPQAGAFMSE